jgi:hypothetical protein
MAGVLVRLNGVGRRALSEEEKTMYRAMTSPGQDFSAYSRAGSLAEIERF